MDRVFLPGEEISETNGFIRGHGTQARGESILSTYLGHLRIINKLVTVDPLCPLRYSPEVGDVVVGRVVGIYSKRWRIELNSRCETHLSLSAINLPGIVQRRKQDSDEISMRSFFDMDNLVVCEVQKVNKNGSAALHTRSEKYRRLSQGHLVVVPHFLLEPLKTRFLQLDGVEAVVGANGFIWLSGGPSSFLQIARAASKIRVAAVAGRVDIECLFNKPG